MLKRFWQGFAQSVTVLFLLWFVISTLKPEWISQGRNLIPSTAPAITIQEIQVNPNSTTPPGSYREAVRRAVPTVVNIFTSKKTPQRNPHEDPWFRFFFGNRQERNEPSTSLGSGVIVSAQGYILTNQHVIEAASEIEVALADGRKVNATVVGADPDTDLAVLKINLDKLPAITFGRIEDIQVGDAVLAIGNPFGVGQTVTSGIVSALGRSHLGINTFENFIQTDAAINPGNSGGALIDTQGHLIGINTAIYSRSGGSMGIGFAIPVSIAKQVMESIITQGSVTRGFLGIEPQDITPELAEAFNLPQHKGALIAGVMKNGPGDQAGLQPGDILVKINDILINDTVNLLNTVSQQEPGQEVSLTVLRKDKTVLLKAKIGKRPAQKSAKDNEQDH
jgi:serine protease DegQ